MTLQLSKIPHLVSVIVRHLVAYLELAASEATGLGKLLIKQLALAAVALLCGGFAIAVGSAWIIAATWHTDWRYMSFGGLLLLFIAGAAIAMFKLRQPSAQGTAPFDRLRAEWSQDQILLDELLHSTAESAVVTPAAATASARASL